ncbi:MAG TPA: 2Fe-2S iron-sulfur cluster binding domain-containing protein [Syntrophaceticus sp.]|mgnify:FL=1|uniref:Ferredoxin n=1 Tax=Syntrophaceticus schinkii TaxID=499207 RepID=A0A0B7MAM6_9FIRM|nr:2Fe-2S iron-sulfur cluster-binding protein [Syntrophaceticus schinkii]HHY30275.1 2Fe-2S iron-sulfur cluster binding domain-containing protein [Syntrophaceticus sp.]MDD2358856.1 2Fe-2S iron-sulfur cluster-binding protein [Syntrophaceticus schinkii]MDD4260794.1 2Fe-2S iron-sulfur cluster-binding protein [Syntrophaceticus schinkii]MDD4674111.1 2Fe-2S iron-sulfur cluster-binding protein [Syntrophaceticus schinkii]CEO87569.1 Ferredoxin [Syntrophaceticus schinkii]
MKIRIDGIETEVTCGETILEAARRAGIDIPTLCYSEAFGGQGVCRFCMVEIEVDGKTRLVASCTYQITEEMEVRTNTPAVQEIRRNLVTLLYRRAPNSDLMKKLFQEYNCDRIEPLDPEESCIMCLLCVKACEKVGANALSSALRGTEKKVATPFDEGSEECMGCSACADICPTGAIPVKEEDGYREIWHRSFEMSRCEECGKYYCTQPVSEHVKEQTELLSSSDNMCSNCRRKKIAAEMAKVCLHVD